MASSLHHYPSCIMYYSTVAWVDVTQDMEKPEKLADRDALASPAR